MHLTNLAGSSFRAVVGWTPTAIWTHKYKRLWVGRQSG